MPAGYDTAHADDRMLNLELVQALADSWCATTKKGEIPLHAALPSKRTPKHDISVSETPC